MLTTSIMKAFLFTSALLALATADSCSDCTAVVSTIAARLSSEESLAQQAVLYYTVFNVHRCSHLRIGGINHAEQLNT